MWLNKILINHQKDSKYYEHDCRYQLGLDISTRGSDFFFDCTHLLYYKCHKISLNRARSYIYILLDKKRKATNPVNQKDNKCFEYAVTVALNPKEIKKGSLRITN